MGRWKRSKSRGCTGATGGAPVVGEAKGCLGGLRGRITVEQGKKGGEADQKPPELGEKT